MGIPLDKAEMLAIFLETFIYGIFFTLFWILLLVLSNRGDAGHVQRRVLIPVAILMLMLASTHLIIDFVRIMQAFVLGISTTTANDYYKKVSNPLHVAKTAIYVTQTLLGDGVIIWRCFMVYNRNWYIAVINGIILLATASSGYVVTWYLFEAKPGTDIFTQSGANWIAAFFVMTMVTNVVCTVLIAWRIYATRRGLNTTKTLLPVTIAIVESGALYASSVMSLLVAFLSGSNGQYPALDVVTPLVGVVFSLIVLQIHFHLGSNSPRNTSYGGDSYSLRWRRTPAGVTSDDSYPMKPVTVRITEQSETGYPGIKQADEESGSLNLPEKMPTKTI